METSSGLSQDRLPLTEFFIDELRDIYGVEKKLAQVLPLEIPKIGSNIISSISPRKQTDELRQLIAENHINYAATEEMEEG